MYEPFFRREEKVSPIGQEKPWKGKAGIVTTLDYFFSLLFSSLSLSSIKWERIKLSCCHQYPKHFFRKKYFLKDTLPMWWRTLFIVWFWRFPVKKWIGIFLRGEKKKDEANKNFCAKFITKHFENLQIEFWVKSSAFDKNLIGIRSIIKSFVRAKA